MRKMTLAVLCAVGLALGLAGAARAGTIVIGDSLIPSGLGLNDTFHLVFVTSTTRIADSTDIASYNTFVQAAADGGSSVVAALGVDWYAIASTTGGGVANTNAVVSAPVYRVDGVQVATGYTDMWNGDIISPINTTELEAVVDVELWSGTKTDGTADWAALGSGLYSGNRTAQSDETGTWWIYNNEFSWSLRWGADSRSLYALSEELTIVPEPATLALLGLGGLGMLLGRKRK